MTPENSLTIQTHLEYSDLYHANRLYRATTTDYTGRLMAGLISLLLGGCYLALLLTRPLEALHDSFWSFTVAGILVIMGAVFLLDLIPRFFVWWAFRRNRDRYSETIQTTFDEHGMAVHQQYADAQYQWNFFKAAVEGRGEFILIFGVGLYFVIPKKAFQSNEEIEVLKSMLTSNLATFKQKLKIPLDF